MLVGTVGENTTFCSNEVQVHDLQLPPPLFPAPMHEKDPPSDLYDDRWLPQVIVKCPDIDIIGEEYSLAEVTFSSRGRAYNRPNVGIKISGESTAGSSSKSYTIKLTEYGGEGIEGLKKRHFNKGMQDPSFLRRKIANDLAKVLGGGVEPMRSAYAEMSINGKHKGLFLFLERVDDDLIKWARAYKPSKIGSMYETISNGLSSPSFNLGGWELQEHNIEQSPSYEGQDLEKLWTVIHDTSSNLADFVNVEQVFLSGALNSIIKDIDGFWYPGSNNYQLYHDVVDGKWVLLVNDHDQILHDRTPRGFWLHPFTMETTEEVFYRRLTSDHVASWSTFHRDALRAVWTTSLPPYNYSHESVFVCRLGYFADLVKTHDVSDHPDAMSSLELRRSDLFFNLAIDSRQASSSFPNDSYPFALQQCYEKSTCKIVYGRECSLEDYEQDVPTVWIPQMCVTKSKMDL